MSYMMHAALNVQGSDVPRFAFKIIFFLSIRYIFAFKMRMILRNQFQVKLKAYKGKSP